MRSSKWKLRKDDFTELLWLVVFTGFSSKNNILKDFPGHPLIFHGFPGFPGTGHPAVANTLACESRSQHEWESYLCSVFLGIIWWQPVSW